MLVQSAGLATEQRAYEFGGADFERARAFQNRVGDWVREGDEPVAVLRAPTGGGKTATFHELIDAREMTLLVYPTNALLEQQRRRLENEGVEAAELSGDTLEGHGTRRTRNLLRHVNRYAADHDVVVTNPDILQAVVQNMYRGNEAMEFFDQFDAIVYDEFHFYDALAASGLLLQMRIVADRQPDPKILLASATPNKDFVAFVRSNLGLPIRDISAAYDSDGDTFREDVELIRQSSDGILDDREYVVERLHEFIEELESDKVGAAVIFNSVRDSNAFHDYLASEHPDLFEHVEKDNGFDTHDAEVDLDEAEFSVLNTTSKGEVGLDYDIRTMIMESPPGDAAASDFLQRFGRAGRQSEATVEVYGLGQMPEWDEEMAFPDFVESVYDALGDASMSLDRLRDLVGLRAAHALHSREAESRSWLNDELREDFADVDRYDRWRGFIETVNDARKRIGGFGATIQTNDPEAKLLDFTEHCFGVFEGLRGRSLSGLVRYPRGDRKALTNYDLLTTLRYYDIEGLDDDGETIEVRRVREDEHPMKVTARLAGYESRPRDFSRSQSDIEEQLQRWMHRAIDRADLDDELDVSSELMHLFFRRIRLVQAVVPTLVRCGDWEFDVELGTIPSIEARRRDV